MFLILAIAPITSNLPAQIVEDGLVSYWNFDANNVGGNLNLAEFPEDEWENHVFIGLDGRADGEFGVFTGIIDEFSVYSRVLEEAEIS